MVYKWLGVPTRYKIGGFFTWFRRRKIHRRALRIWKKTGVQHHVVIISKNTALIVNPSWIKKHNDNKLFKKISIYKALREAVYSTPMHTKNPPNGERRD